MLAETEFSNVRFHGDDEAAAKVYEAYEPLLPEDVAEGVSWIVAQPNRVNVNRLEIMPTCQAPGGVAVEKL
jgi:NADP-dependent 3-hydroxy acid dehydrogenase YdfG